MYQQTPNCNMCWRMLISRAGEMTRARSVAFMRLCRI